MESHSSFPQTNSSAQAPVVYGYLSYRAFMRDFLAYRKHKFPGFSISAFCLRTGVMSKSSISMVLNERRSIPIKKLPLIADALGLSARERRYFESLVHFNHARNEREKHIHLKQLMEARPAKLAENLPELSYGILYSWHCLVILEMAKIPGFCASGKWISQKLRGRITVLEARRAIETLLEAKLLVANAKGQLIPNQGSLFTSDEVKSLAIQKYHHSCLALGAEILKNTPVEEREFGSVNLALTSQGLKLAKERIKAFREEILSLASAGKPGTEVCQFNFQLFNLEK